LEFCKPRIQKGEIKTPSGVRVEGLTDQQAYKVIEIIRNFASPASKREKSKPLQG